MAELAGRRVVVTGASGALGTGVVTMLLARGATVHAPLFEAEWKGDPRVLATHVGSLDDEGKLTAYYAALPALWASIHLVGGFAMAKLADTSLADFEKQWRQNTVTCFLACREAVRAIRRTGAAGGRIVNVAARPALTPAGGMIAYTASKAGVAALTQSLAVELLPESILVNAVVPSVIDSPANRASMPKANHDAWPKPAEIAEAIAFLASPANALTTGTLLPVYGHA